MKKKNKTAQEPKAQEQYVVNVSIDDAKLDRINSLITELQKELESLPDAIKVTYPNS